MQKAIKELISYAKSHLFLNDGDAIYAENMLLGYFGLAEPYAGEIDEKAIASYETPDPIVNEIIEKLVVAGVPAGEAERKAVFAFGAVSPRPSSVQDAFEELEGVSPKDATEYLYDLSVANYYVRKTQIDKNIHYDVAFEQGSPLEVSINLSKPEKKNSDIAKLLTTKSSTYPLCLLCPENLGFYGSDRHPARGNLRYVELQIEGKTWYLQFSPYGYFDRHCILFQKEHVPMAVNPSIFAVMLGFVERFPHYFLGSNADLPIVGGSILNHEHFQGGAHLLPLMKADIKEIVPSRYEGVELGIVDFYATALRVKGKNKEQVLAQASDILALWRGYDDPSRNVLHETEGKIHNTITAIARKVEDDYILYLLLRNNRCDEEHPDGIFHVDKSRQHIKSEGIGLIEAAGLFILPARLQRQGAAVEDVVKSGLNDEEAKAKYEDIAPFLDMAHQMKRTGQTLRAYLGEVCQNILKDVAVFKDDEGLKLFLRRLS